MKSIFIQAGSLIVLSAIFNTSFGPIAQAQIIPDNTLGLESSQLTPNILIDNVGFIDRIDGGALRGRNLFHSFSRFNIAIDQGAYFANPTGVQNIFARVTDAPSNIGGVLGVNGTANLFLLNPNGILFGPNSRLDVQGSFVATTANAIRFGTAGLFSATELQNNVLLSIQPDAIPFTQLNPQAEIVNLSRDGLRVGNGASAALIGGNVRVDGGVVSAPGGTISLGGLAAPGTIVLNLNDRDLTLGFPSGVRKGNVSLINQSLLASFPEGGKRIQIDANQLNIQDSRILSYINSGLGGIGAKGSDFIFNVDEGIVIRQKSFIATFVNDGVIGNSGNILINAKALTVLDGSRLETFHSGRGDSGNIVINASDRVTFDGEDLTIAPNTFPLASRALTNRFAGEGKTGRIEVNTNRLQLTNGGLLETSLVGGQGDIGSITINAKDSVIIDGVTQRTRTLNTKGSEIVQPVPSGILAYVGEQTKGQGGDIQIATGSLLINQGGVLNTGSSGKGNAGNIKITASGTVTVAGTAATAPQLESTISTSGEDVDFTGGNLQITADALSVLTGARVASESQGGNGGSIKIDVRDRLVLQGEPQLGAVRSVISSSIQATDPQKQGGDIRITTGSLIMDQGHQIAAAAFGAGRGGNIAIDARDLISLDGTDRAGVSTVIGTGLARRVDGRTDVPSGGGKGGDIRINANRLSVTNGAVINSIANIPGDAGSIEIQTRSGIDLAGRNRLNEPSRISTEVTEQGNGIGGDLRITTGNLALNDGGNIAASNNVRGRAGFLSVVADRVRLDNGASIETESASGQGGSLRLDARDYLLLRRSSFVSATARQDGDGGNLSMTTPFIVAVPRENSDIIANAFRGNGGQIQINTRGLFGITAAAQQTGLSNITASSREGVQGTVTIIQPDVRPEQGLLQLPENLLDASNQIAQACANNSAGKQLGSFVVSGRGSLPPSPIEPLAQSTGLQPLASMNPANLAQIDITKPAAAIPITTIEAQGWQKRSDGTVILLAQTDKPIVDRAIVAASNCNQHEFKH